MYSNYRHFYLIIYTPPELCYIRYNHIKSMDFFLNNMYLIDIFYKIWYVYNFDFWLVTYNIPILYCSKIYDNFQRTHGYSIWLPVIIYDYWSIYLLSSRTLGCKTRHIRYNIFQYTYYYCDDKNYKEKYHLFEW